jgi:hypothetical protein
MFESLNTPEEVFSLLPAGCGVAHESHTVNMLDDIAWQTRSKELCQMLRDHAIETHQHIRIVGT